MKRTLISLAPNRKGQDLVEYALLAGFLAAAVVALSPAILSTSVYFSAVVNLLSQAVAQTAGS